ncbi:MAG: hypothetical protein HQ518_21465 [Rhodopirellula sp.]|nr:hypothetical protein [Rhodopirellula sp.]
MSSSPRTPSSFLTSKAGENMRTTEPRLKRSLLWFASGLAIAVAIGLLFGFVPTRFRLLGLLAVGQGCVVGALLGRAAVPLKMHDPRLGACGGFVCGVSSVGVTAAFWWAVWAAEAKKPEQPRPDAALVARMLAQMPKPADGDEEQLKAYEENRRQMTGFLERQTAPPEVELGDWLAHRASAVVDYRAAATLIGLLELILAGVAAGLLARISVGAPFCSTCQTWRRVIRSHLFPAPVPEPLRQLLPDRAPESILSVAAEFSACGCDARPTINLSLETTDRKTQPIAVVLNDEQFADLKRLLDEAQGMK